MARKAIDCLTVFVIFVRNPRRSLQMIVCSCQHITDKDIHAAIGWMRASDETTIITPGKIYHALGKRADCGGCMKLFVATMRANPSLEVPVELRGMRSKTTRSLRHEGQREGHRVPKQSAQN